jgi:hypothetical protein
VALFELMLNEDQVSPAAAVGLDLTLLAMTPSGETRTASQLTEALRRRGIRPSRNPRGATSAESPSDRA